MIRDTLCAYLKFVFLLGLQSVEKGLTSGRLAVCLPRWWAPVVAPGNRCQGEGPTGAGPAGNVSSLHPEWKGTKRACAGSDEKKKKVLWQLLISKSGGFANKVSLLFPQKKELKLVFKIRILRKRQLSLFFSCLQSLYNPMSKGNSKFIHPISLWGLVPLKQIMEMQSQRYEAADVSVSLSGCGCYLDPSSGNNKRTLCSAVWHRKGLPGRGEEAGGEQKKKRQVGC